MRNSLLIAVVAASFLLSACAGVHKPNNEPYSVAEPFYRLNTSGVRIKIYDQDGERWSAQISALSDKIHDTMMRNTSMRGLNRYSLTSVSVKTERRKSNLPGRMLLGLVSIVPIPFIWIRTSQVIDYSTTYSLKNEMSGEENQYTIKGSLAGNSGGWFFTRAIYSSTVYRAMKKAVVEDINNGLFRDIDLIIREKLNNGYS